MNEIIDIILHIYEIFILITEHRTWPDFYHVYRNLRPPCHRASRSTYLQHRRKSITNYYMHAGYNPAELLVVMITFFFICI